MCDFRKSYRIAFHPLFVLVYFFFHFPSYSQNIKNTNPVHKIPDSTFTNLIGHIKIIPGNSTGDYSALMPLNNLTPDKAGMFYNSLKVKASKNLITRTLYDYLIVSNDSLQNKKITGSSDAGYLAYSGKKIRKIEIQRLNVFGSNISDPANYNPNKVENIINKTHVYTKDNVIRNNLLFSAGENVSPLLLSDNERIIRQLPFINDARIIVVPISEDEVDIIVVTKDAYSLGVSYSYKSMTSGSLSVFEKNVFGLGQELEFKMPYDIESPGSPGIGAYYMINNLWKSFINMNVFYSDEIGDRSYGLNLSRRLVSTTTKYAGGILVKHLSTNEDLDTLPAPEPVEYNLQDYWLLRSFMIDKKSVSRIIVGARYVNNNVFKKPLIPPDSYYPLQTYKLYIGSIGYSFQKFYKSNLIYSYGKTEDIPYGGLINLTFGKELNEFKRRTYLGTEISAGKSSKELGYFYASTGISTFINEKHTEQGQFFFNIKYFSNLVSLGDNLVRNFVNINYKRGFERYSNEYLVFNRENGFSGFRNDTIKGDQRIHIGLESVLFSPIKYYGFRFAFFGFTDFEYLSGSNMFAQNGFSLSSIGLGIRLRNNNTVFNTLQVRFAFYPNPPVYSKVNYITFSEEQLLRPNNFDPGPPAIIPYR